MSILAQALALLSMIAIALISTGLRPVWLIPGYGLLAFAALLSGFPKHRAGLSIRVLPCLIATGVFFGYILCRIVVSPVEYIARPDLFMVLGGLIVYFITATHATSPRSRLVFTSAFLLLACAHVIVGAIQFTKGNNFMPFDFLPRADYKARASGFYGNPNHFAGFLAVILPVSLSLAFLSRWRLMGKILAGYVAVVCVVGILMSGSRGGYAGAAIGVFTFAVLSLRLARQWMRRDVWTLLVTVLAFAVIGVGWITVSAFRGSDFLSARMEASGSDAMLRVNLWRAAITQFQLNPLFGTGSATYLYYGREFRVPSVDIDPVYAHGDYFQMLGEFGLTAIVGLAAFLVVHLRNGWKVITEISAGRTEEAEREGPGFYGDNSLALTVGALCGIVACLIHSIGDFNLHIPPNTLLMAFLFGSLANPFSVLRPDPKTGSERTQKILRYAPFVLPALGVCLAWVALPKWPAERYADQARVLLSDWRSLEESAVAHRAADFARQGIQRDPKDVDLYLCLADIHTALAEMAEDPATRDEQFRQSIEVSQRGLQIAPREVRFVITIARAFDAVGRFDESEPFYQRALELDPNGGIVLMEYGAHLHMRGKFDEAETFYTRACKASFGPSAALHLQRLQEDRKAPAKAP